MSDLTAASCRSDKGNGFNGIFLIIILLFLCGGDNGLLGGSDKCGSDNGINGILPIILILCLCNGSC